MPTLNWIGKEKVLTHHNEVPYRVLDRKYTFGDTPDSGNMIIHGDNLEALKSLLPRYENSIKCIYIDPPYNTGNEGWVYNDNVNDPHIRKWLGKVVGSEFDDLTRHDKWLSMMYPRMVLLQRLLSEDGVIFISIDDNEQANLRLLCNEIFGAQNFICNVIWEKADSPRMDAKLYSERHDFILVYSKSIEHVALKRVKTGATPEHYNKVSADGRRYYLKPLRYMGSADAREARPNLYFPIVAPDGSDVYPKRSDGTDGRWRWSREKVEADKDRIEFIKTKDGWSVYSRIYAADDMSVPMETIWYNSVVESNRNAMATLKQIFGNEKNFTTPKPVKLIEYAINLIADKDSIILDSFAGSGTTAHAVLNLNQQDGGNRKFILCEMCDYADTVTAERVRRVMAGYGEGKNAVEGTGGSFDFFELGETIFDPSSDNLNDNADTEQIKEYVWYSETHAAYVAPGAGAHPYLLGSFKYTNYYFYYIKGEETCLDWDFLKTFTERDRAEAYVIYADRCVLTLEELLKFNITFKKIPRDIKRV